MYFDFRKNDVLFYLYSRIGYESWRRNISIAMGNAKHDPIMLDCLKKALSNTNSEVLKEHFSWAISQQINKAKTKEKAISTRQHERLIRIVEKGLPRDA